MYDVRTTVFNMDSKIRNPQVPPPSGLKLTEIRNPNVSPDLENIEIELLLEGLYQRYGYDFREYAPASLKRRILNFVASEKLQTISGLQEKVLHDHDCMERLLLALSINVTSMFRDPAFFLTFREKVVPILRTYPFIRIWCAGCSTGEEVYSIAILLREEGLLEKSKIYATDMNEVVLKKAKDGIYHLSLMKEYTNNYQQASGKASFSDYYDAAYENAILDPSLKKIITFAQHNLVTDSSFNEFHVIMCRNVMIYFNKSLQDRVYNLLNESLIMLGILCLGERETIRFTALENSYDELEKGRKVYRKIR